MASQVKPVAAGSWCCGLCKDSPWAASTIHAYHDTSSFLVCRTVSGFLKKAGYWSRKHA